MKTIKGDLIKLAIAGEFDVLLHGANCFNTMGAGLAYQISKIFPEAFRADLDTIKGDINKLGTYSSAESRGIRVVNCYTQYHFGTNKINVDYDAIDKVMAKIAIDFKDKRIGIPLIGVGLAGGDWNIISKIIEKHLPNATIVEYLK